MLLPQMIIAQGEFTIDELLPILLIIGALFSGLLMSGLLFFSFRMKLPQFAIINCCLCVVISLFLQPWTLISNNPLAGPDLLTKKVLTSIWGFFLLASIAAALFCFFGKNDHHERRHHQSRRRKRERRKRRAY